MTAATQVYATYGSSAPPLPNYFLETFTGSVGSTLANRPSDSGSTYLYQPSQIILDGDGHAPFRDITNGTVGAFFAPLASNTWTLSIDFLIDVGAEDQAQFSIGTLRTTVDGSPGTLRKCLSLLIKENVVEGSFPTRWNIDLQLFDEQDVLITPILHQDFDVTGSPQNVTVAVGLSTTLVTLDGSPFGSLNAVPFSVPNAVLFLQYNDIGELADYTHGYIDRISLI